MKVQTCVGCWGRLSIGWLITAGFSPWMGSRNQRNHCIGQLLMAAPCTMQFYNNHHGLLTLKIEVQTGKRTHAFEFEKWQVRPISRYVYLIGLAGECLLLACRLPWTLSIPVVVSYTVGAPCLVQFYHDAGCLVLPVVMHSVTAAVPCKHPCKYGSC